MNEALEQRWASAQPRSSLSALPGGLAERRGTRHRLSRVRPPVRMRVFLIVPLQPSLDPLYKLRSTVEVSSPEELSLQHAEEQFHLIQPRPVLRREVEHVFVVGVAEKLSP